VNKLSPGPRLIAVGGIRAQGCKGTYFPISLYIYICLFVNTYITAGPIDENKSMRDSLSSIPWMGIGGLRLPQAL
jgi:hypothetical protein